MNKVAMDFLERCFARGETIAILLRRLDSAMATTNCCVRDGACLAVSSVAHVREFHRSEYLRCRESALAAASALKRTSLPFVTFIWISMKMAMRGSLRCWIPTPFLKLRESSPLLRVSTKCFGKSMVLTSRDRKRRLDCLLTPTAEIPLVPIATGFSACQGSSIANTIRLITSRWNIQATQSGILPTSGLRASLAPLRFHSAAKHRDRCPVNIRFPKRIGHGF
jgi:hypothetical protein